MMNEVNKTLYIPLYGKAYVSKKGIILDDRSAESIWEKEGFPLKGKSKSKWLAYYMGMRSRVFDDWTRDRMLENKDGAVIHLGCGLDSRAQRVGATCRWYDVDFPDVIEEKKRYFCESESYKMLGFDIRDRAWLDAIGESRSATVIIEGVSMYLTPEELSGVLSMICQRFESVALLVDCYTTFAAKASKVKNPINDVGVTKVYGMDDPKALEIEGLSLVCEHEMTPKSLVEELSGMEKTVFRKIYGGKMSKKLYRLYEYKK